MAIMALRLRQLREDQNTSQDDIAAVAGVSQATWSIWEKETPKQFSALERLARKFGVSADYLLGLTDDPTLHRGEGLPEAAWEIVELLEELPEEVQEHVVVYARTLVEAERRANLREYDRMMAVIMALPEGNILRESVEEALRAGEGGDTAAAFAVIDAYLAGRDARDMRAAQAEPQQQPVEQG